MFNSTTTKEPDSPYYHWTEEIAIGHEVIDEDHRSIFDLANRLQAEILSQEDSEYSIVGEVIVELIEHTGGHFAREEALMQEIGYPGYEKHRHEHAMLMERVNNLLRRFMDGRKNLSLEVADFIQKRLVPHIMISDMKLGDSLHAPR
jgi:hemerythrin-like metal-binding protein